LLLNACTPGGELQEMLELGGSAAAAAAAGEFGGAAGAAAVLGAGFDLLGDLCASATGSHVYVAGKSGHTCAAVAVCPPPERRR